MNCVCRQGKDLLGQPCRQTEERRLCLAIRGTARGAIARGMGQEVSREEALALLDRAEREGLVVQPSNTKKAMFICFCCGCCCGMLGAAKEFPRPSEYLRSNYFAAVDPNLCNDCQTCRARCPMDALSAKDGVAAVDLDRCIGCGLCVSTCPTGALHLVAKERPVVPPADRDALYLKILRERYGLLETARLIGKTLLGVKI